MNAPSAAVRDPALLFDVHVYQLSGRGSLVAHRFWFAYPNTGGLADMGRQRRLIPGQDAADRRTVQLQVIHDPMPTPPTRETQAHDPTLGPAA
jgi:hypothetical protein